MTAFTSRFFFLYSLFIGSNFLFYFFLCSVCMRAFASLRVHVEGRGYLSFSSFSFLLYTHTSNSFSLFLFFRFSFNCSHFEFRVSRHIQSLLILERYIRILREEMNGKTENCAATCFLLRYMPFHRSIFANVDAVGSDGI